MATFISYSPAETESLGESWGRAAQSGWVIGLSGDLGAGKTQLVKGIARGLNVAEKVHSPTFALVNEYSGGRLPLFHLDFYRLESREQIIGAGLEQYVYQPRGVSVIEWIERWGALVRGEDGRWKMEDGTELSRFAHRPTSAAPSFFRFVKIEVIDEIERRIIYEDFGS